MYMLGFVLASIIFAVVQSNEDCQKPLGMESGFISDEQISASSQWSDSHAASQSRLNFNATTLKAGGWSAGPGDLNKWLQIDLRTQESEVAFVATQGRNGHSQWVKTYKLQYSSDGVNFRTYSEEGETTDKVFEGNTDSDTVVYHVLTPTIKARFIRFRPITWEGHASMRVELYGCQVIACEEALGMEDGEIPDIQISASSEWSDNHAASQGRLNYKATTVKEGGWSAGLGDLNKWLQIDLGNRATTVTSVATQGRNNHGQWVTKYRLQYSNDGFNFKFYKERGEEDSKMFEGNTDPDTVVYHTLNPPIRARFIRFRPITWEGRASMRVELYGCRECDEALGMGNGAISDTQISASSKGDDNHTASQGRLNFEATALKAGGWSPRRNDYNIWLQIDLGNRDTKVTGVATQGGSNDNQWVTKYRLQYSNSIFNFEFYKERGEEYNKIFEGNTNPDAVVYHTLYPPIRARYIRFRPITWEGYASMRVELYGCKETFQCPICSGKGENALTLCNNGITYEICNREKPICEIAKRFLFGEVRVSRWCSDKETYDYLKGILSTSTKKGFCTKSRCKAVLPEE